MELSRLGLYIIISDVGILVKTVPLGIISEQKRFRK